MCIKYALLEQGVYEISRTRRTYNPILSLSAHQRNMDTVQRSVGWYLTPYHLFFHLITVFSFQVWRAGVEYNVVDLRGA